MSSRPDSFAPARASSRPDSRASWPGSSQPAVRLRGVSVSYGRGLALDRLSLDVEPGRVLAIVGPNGAGKSTLFRAMLGLVPLEAGEATVLGHPATALPPSVRGRLAFVPENHPELPGARVADVVAFRERLYPSFDRRRFDELTWAATLAPSTRVGELSRGQRALVVVGLAIAQQPGLLLLDDPTLGLDPLARRLIIQAILSSVQGGATTVIVATHEIADVERIADDILLLSRGHAHHPAEEVATLVARSAAVSVPLGTPLDLLARLASVLHVWPRRDHLEVIVWGDPLQQDDDLIALGHLAGPGADLRPRAISLEDLTLAWLAHERTPLRSPHA
ncbi:MAG: ABC transporter ATP-binding protein [Myxococcales bacterium]|nr:MAG: ABC transporter ATP-binding protein [Myxococcales bacterium]